MFLSGDISWTAYDKGEVAIALGRVVKKAVGIRPTESVAKIAKIGDTNRATMYQPNPKDFLLQIKVERVKTYTAPNGLPIRSPISYASLNSPTPASFAAIRLVTNPNRAPNIKKDNQKPKACPLVRCIEKSVRFLNIVVFPA